MRFATEQIYIGALRGLGVMLVFLGYYLLKLLLFVNTLMGSVAQ